MHSGSQQLHDGAVRLFDGLCSLGLMSHSHLECLPLGQLKTDLFLL